VDVEELVQRAGIADVVAETTMGLAGRTVDVVRRELAGLDTVVAGIVDRVLRRGPGPAGPPALMGSPAADGGTNRETVSGRYAGPVSRGAAAAIDVGVILGSYSAGVGLVGFLAQALFGFSIGNGTGTVASVVLAGWAALYIAVSTAISGRTVGKAVVGLIVVSRTGHPVGPFAAVVRMLTVPFSTSIFAAGLLLIVLRRDHRALHDLIARTAVVYDWGDRPAQLPAPLTAYLRAHDAA
jgi:uncharacterized RDD family membrane protein YckC